MYSGFALLLPSCSHPATSEPSVFVYCLSVAHLQELCAHEPLPATQHAKYTTAAAPAAGPSASQAAPIPAATLQLRLTPNAVARQQQSGLRDKLPGGGKGGKGAAADKGSSAGQPAAWVECELQVSFVSPAPCSAVATHRDSASCGRKSPIAAPTQLLQIRMRAALMPLHAVHHVTLSGCLPSH